MHQQLTNHRFRSATAVSLHHNVGTAAIVCRSSLRHYVSNRGTAVDRLPLVLELQHLSVGRPSGFLLLLIDLPFLAVVRPALLPSPQAQQWERPPRRAASALLFTSSFCEMMLCFYFDPWVRFGLVRHNGEFSCCTSLLEPLMAST